MNKEQAIKLFEGLMKDTEKAKKSWGTGDTGYYASEALISSYNLAISVLKAVDVEEQPKRWVVKYLRHRCYYYFVEWANTDTFDPIGGPDLDYLKVAEFTDRAKAEAVATLVEGSVEEV